MIKDVANAALGLLIMGVAFYGVAKYPGLLYRSVRDMQGGWRIAALLPLLVLIPITVVTAVALWQGSNLWPIFLIFAAPVLLVYQAGVDVCAHADAQPRPIYFFVIVTAALAVFV